MKKIFSKKNLSLFALGLGLAAVSDAALAGTKCSTGSGFKVCITQNGTNQPAIISTTNLTGYNATVNVSIGVANCGSFQSNLCNNQRVTQNIYLQKVNYVPGQTKVTQTRPISRGLWAVVSTVRTLDNSRQLGHVAAALTLK